LMVWPYRNSLHFMQDQCLKIGEKVSNLRKLFDMYHKNITSKLPWWREEVAPFIKLRARMWEGFEIYVGLNKKLRNMPNYTNGMILIGDTAGLESTELCDGVPAAWFSAEIAAKIAIQAIKANDTSILFLKRYDKEIKSHPIIQWSITAKNRFNLRIAQKEHDEKKLKRYIHNGWGLGSLTQFTTPFFKILIDYLSKDPLILSKWIKMYFRYYQNWLHENYDYSEKKLSNKESVKRPRFKQNLFSFSLISLNSILRLLYKVKRFYRWFLFPFSRSANTFMKNLLKIIEPVYLFLIKLIEPWADKISKKLIRFVDKAEPAIFFEKNIRKLKVN